MTALPASPFAPLARPPFDRWMAGELSQLTEETLDRLGSRLVALLLGGGYGRGEGGVLEVDGKQRPYNDLDLFVVVTDPRGVTSDLAHVAHRAEARLGIAVDFSHPLTPGDIRRWECRLMWHELLGAHRVLYGAPDALAQHAPPGVAAAPPPVEASRLLLNRGAGLLRARRVALALEPPPDPEFVRRNAMKALQSAGDAFLIARGELPSTLTARVDALPDACVALPAPVQTAVVAGYREAVRFHFAPDRGKGAVADDALLTRATAVWLTAFLAVEEVRHARPFPDLTRYLAWRGAREPAGFSPRTWARNLKAALARRRWSFASPHEGLYRSLPRLLEAPPGAAGWDAESASALADWQARPA